VLLRKTTEEQVKKLNIRELRRLIKEVDDVILPEDARFYDRMQANIMAAIETDEAFACTASSFTLGEEVQDHELRNRLLKTGKYWGGLFRRWSSTQY
jgi:hypothetical protein